MKKTLLAVIFLWQAAMAHAFQLSGFDQPESAVRDPETGAVFVSNVNGDPRAKDGNGYISRISPSGSVLIQKFIGGKEGGPVLDAPKGLAIWADRLIVTDLDKVRVFNKKDGSVLREIDCAPQGAVYLNDPVMDSRGILYLSDRMADKIFSVDLVHNGEVKVFYEGSILGGPNGLAINPRSNNLIIATWRTGSLLELDRSKKIHFLKRGLESLDGVDFDDQWNLYVSSFKKGEIYRIPFLGRGTLSVFASNLDSPADISFDRRKRELLVPLMQTGVLETIAQVPKPAAAAQSV